MTYHRNEHNVAIANVSRRRLLKGVAGTGVFVLAAQFPAVRSAMAYATGADKMPHGVVTNPHIFVSIDKDGIVTIVAHRAEMGNGAARTTLPMIVADELDADWGRVRVVQSPGDEETYGNQDTDGSRSVRHFIQPMRQVGAGARKMLETAAAKRWASTPTKSRRASTKSCTRRRARSSAMANSRPMRRLCRRRRSTRCSSRRRARSAISARATSPSSTCSISRPATRLMART